MTRSRETVTTSVAMEGIHRRLIAHVRDSKRRHSLTGNDTHWSYIHPTLPPVDRPELPAPQTRTSPVRRHSGSSHCEWHPHPLRHRRTDPGGGNCSTGSWRETPTRRSAHPALWDRRNDSRDLGFSPSTIRLPADDPQTPVRGTDLRPPTEPPDPDHR